MRSGFPHSESAFTLPELMLVLALAGILLGMAAPRLTGVLDGIEVRTAAHHLAAAHLRARMMALTGGQVLVLSVEAHRLAIRRRSDGTTLWSHPGPALGGVALDGAPRQFTFAPEGLTLGLSNATLRLTRNAAARTVVISRLGRVRITP